MTDVIAASVGRPRFYLTLLAIFAGVALLLSIAGLYGVMSYVVAQRTREIGIRSALGSTPRRTLGLVMRQGMLLVALGVMIGLFGGFALTRLLGSLLYGVSPLDALTWLAVTVTLAAAGAVAILLPARRASVVQPMIAMRVD
jgi:ABC-type antimicrobial peptide transport system permease subunit